MIAVVYNSVTLAELCQLLKIVAGNVDVDVRSGIDRIIAQVVQ